MDALRVAVQHRRALPAAWVRGGGAGLCLRVAQLVLDVDAVVREREVLAARCDRAPEVCSTTRREAAEEKRGREMQSCSRRGEGNAKLLTDLGLKVAVERLRHHPDEPFPCRAELVRLSVARRRRLREREYKAAEREREGGREGGRERGRRERERERACTPTNNSRRKGNAVPANAPAGRRRHMASCVILRGMPALWPASSSSGTRTECLIRRSK